jgi:hypothetical protein
MKWNLDTFRVRPCIPEAATTKSGFPVPGGSIQVGPSALVNWTSLRALQWTFHESATGGG